MDTGVVEVLVKRKENHLFSTLQVVCIVLAVISFVLMIFMPITIILIALFVGLRYVFFYLADVEYEYSYFDRELTIDKIYAKSRRKKAAAYLVEKVEIAAPEKSYKLDNHKNRQCKEVDYSSGNQDSAKFVIYYEGSTKVILEYDETLVKTMRMQSPSKIFEN